LRFTQNQEWASEWCVFFLIFPRLPDFDSLRRASVRDGVAQAKLGKHEKAIDFYKVCVGFDRVLTMYLKANGRI
jgi:hypothetical protein